MRVTTRLNLPALRRIREAAADGLSDGAEMILDESQRLVPLDEATLEGSGRVDVDRAQLAAAISYDTPYAVRQHEDLTLRHSGGRTAKYLERPLREHGPRALAHVGDRIRRVT